MPEIRKKPLLFEEYPDLEGNIPWINLAPLRTPVKKLTKIEEKLGILEVNMGYQRENVLKLLNL